MYKLSYKQSIKRAKVEFSKTAFFVSYNLSYVNYVHIISAIIALILTTPASAKTSYALNKIEPKTAGLLEFIGSIEAPDGYDSYSFYAYKGPPKRLTTMTIAEVLAWQESIDARSYSEAAGRFQIMEDTLRPLVKKYNISTSHIFNAEMQNRLAMILLEQAGWDPKSNDYIRMANNIAKVWAALPVVSGPDKGKSYYRNTKGAKNRAQTSPTVYLSVLRSAKSTAQILKAVKLSKQKRRVASNQNGAVRIKRLTHSKITKTAKISGGKIGASKVLVYYADPYQVE